MSARVYRARWVLPISRPPISDGAVAVENGRITYVGAWADSPSLAGAAIELGAAVLLPGLVNAHTHLELTPFRGLLDGLSFGRWIVRLTNARDAVMNPERHVASARLGIAEGVACGITTFADCTAAGFSLHAMRDMRVRGVVYHEVFGPDSRVAESAVHALRETVDASRALAVPRVTIGVSPHAPYTVSDALFSSVARYATDEALPIAVHAAESDAETALIADASGEFANGLRARGIDVSVRAPSPIMLLERLGVLGPRTLLIHTVRLSAGDIAAIACAQSGVAHCPASNAKLGHGIAPVTRLASAGVAIGLGTDSVASNDHMDLLDEARLAALLQRAHEGRPDVWSATEALHAATLGGARALGLADEIGSLDVGKAADLAAFPIAPPPQDLSPGDVSDALIHGATPSNRAACLTVVAGQELVRHGRLVADVSADARVVAEAARALRESLAAH